MSPSGLIKLPGLLDVVQFAWSPTLLHANPFRVLDLKLWNAEKALQSWSMKQMGSVILQLNVTREVILRLDIAVAEDSRALSMEERQLRNELKVK